MVFTEDKSNIIIDFMSKVIKTDKCWEWNYTINAYGYGIFWFNHTNYRAHRASYLLFKGEIPEGLIVRHMCDNRK